MSLIVSLNHEAMKTLIYTGIFNNPCVLKKRVKIIQYFKYIHSDKGHIIENSDSQPMCVS